MISIIMTVYNGERFLKESLNSIVNQTYKNWELIVVDDGSADETLNILKSYSANDSRIKIYSGRHAGISEARYIGLNKAMGDRITFVDSDDYLEPDALELMQRENADIVKVDYKNFKAVVESDEAPFTKTEIKTGKQILYDKKMPWSLWGQLFSRLLFEALKPLIESEKNILKYTYLEDVFILSRIYYISTSVINVNRVLYHYRVYDGSSSNKRTIGEWHYELIKACDINNQFYLDKNETIIVGNMLYGQFSVFLKYWFINCNYKADKDRQTKFSREIRFFYEKYRCYMKGESFIHRAMVDMWRYCSLIWRLIVSLRFRQ